MPEPLDTILTRITLDLTHAVNAAQKEGHELFSNHLRSVRRIISNGPSGIQTGPRYRGSVDAGKPWGQE